MGVGVGPGQEVVELRLRPAMDQFGENVGKPGLGVDLIQLAGLCRPANYAERLWDDTSLSRW